MFLFQFQKKIHPHHSQMPANMKNAGLLLSLIATVLAVLVIEATCAHALVVDKDEILPKDVTDSTTDWLEQEAIYRLLKALHTQVSVV